MPASESGIEDVLPEMNQRSSAMTARRKTRFVVRSGRISIGGSDGSEEGREREKRSGCGAKRESVPVPVLVVQNHQKADCGSLRCDVDLPVRTVFAIV